MLCSVVWWVWLNVLWLFDQSNWFTSNSCSTVYNTPSEAKYIVLLIYRPHKRNVWSICVVVLRHMTDRMTQSHPTIVAKPLLAMCLTLFSFHKYKFCMDWICSWFVTWSSENLCAGPNISTASLQTLKGLNTVKWQNTLKCYLAFYFQKNLPAGLWVRFKLIDKVFLDSLTKLNPTIYNRKHGHWKAFDGQVAQNIFARFSNDKFYLWLSLFYCCSNFRLILSY